VKVTPQGFEVQDVAEYKELRGRITKVTLVRKLFEDGGITCSSPDGIQSEDGLLCDECLHPRGQPRLRIQLACGPTVYVFDLPSTSAQNFFALEDKAEAQGCEIFDWRLKLTVVCHNHWGEVVFERIDKLPSRNKWPSGTALTNAEH
jgi:hypothetical protein